MRARPRRCRLGSSPERLLARLPPLEHGDGVVARRAEQLAGEAEVAADDIRGMRVRPGRGRDAARTGRGEKVRMRVQLAHRLAHPGRRYLHRDARLRDRIDDLRVVERVDAVAEDLDQVGMRQRIEQAAARRAPKLVEVPPPRLLHADLADETRLAVDAEAVDPVHRAQQEVPRIRRQQCPRFVLASGHVIHFEAELDRQPALTRTDDGVDVRVKVVGTALGLVRHRPERSELGEVVAVLGEADLVDAGVPCSLDEGLDRPRVVRDLLAAVAQMHVVVDDHRSAATRSRSALSVTLSRRGSPSTTRTRPPAASTAAEQSVQSEPVSAPRSTAATNACGVCTTRSSSRATVSTMRSPSTRLTVSAIGSAGTAPSQPSPSAVTTRSTTASSSSGRAASCTSTTAASAGTSATPIRTE